MRPEYSVVVERGRLRSGTYASAPGAPHGLFELKFRGVRFLALVGIAYGWEHVSVSLPKRKRCPTWVEMCWIKRLFWAEHEAVIQIHPPASEYVDNHSGCLHLWRYTESELPRPAWHLVGDPALGRLA